VTGKVVNVLFLCTGNSARSIIAERLLDRLGGGRFRAFSAGSRPSGRVNPNVAAFLATEGFDTSACRSKSWDEFAAPGAPAMDLVITVCDAAAGESCPLWPGRPAKAHWSAPDPAAHDADPAKARAVARKVFDLMHRRISSLVNLPAESLDPATLEARAREISAATAPDSTKD